MVGGALPFPAVVLVLPVVAVALPEGDVTAAQALCPGLVPADEGGRLGLRVGYAVLGGERLSIGLQLRHRKVGEGLLAGVELAQFVSAADAPAQRFYLVAEPLGVSLAPGEGAGVLGKIQVQGVAADQGLVHFEVAHDAGAAEKSLLEGVADGFEIPCVGFLRLEGQDGCHQGEGQKKTLHFFCFRISQMMIRIELRMRPVVSARKSSGSPLR